MRLTHPKQKENRQAPTMLIGFYAFANLIRFCAITSHIPSQSNRTLHARPLLVHATMVPGSPCETWNRLFAVPARRQSNTPEHAHAHNAISLRFFVHDRPLLHNETSEVNMGACRWQRNTTPRYPNFANLHRRHFGYQNAPSGLLPQPPSLCNLT